MAKPKQPAIPAVPNDVTPAMRGFLSAMREVLQVQSGQGRGDELDKAVTFRDLGVTSASGSGTAMLGRVINGLIANGEVVAQSAVERPTTPTGVSVTTYIGGIMVSWDNPRYSGHAYTEVFAQPTAVDAQNQPIDAPALNTETMLLGTAGSPLLGVQARTMLGYYVWVRHVNTLGQVGPVHAALGSYVYLPPSPSYLLEQLTNEITRDQLSIELQEPIDLVPVLQISLNTEITNRTSVTDTLASSITSVSAVANAKNKTYLQASAPTSGMAAGDMWVDSDDNNKLYRYSGSAWVLAADARIASNAAAIIAEQTARANGDSANATAINTLSATVDGHTASIQTNATAIANLDGTYTAQWSTKTTVGALNGGFGIFNDGTTTRFTVHANRFAIMDTSLGNTPFVPFVVSGGKTVIADAFIRTAYIEQLAAGQITAAKINSLNLNAIQITGGSISLGGGDNNMIYADGGGLGVGKTTSGGYGGWGYNWNTIIYNNGHICTNNLTASNGTFTGTVNATSGSFTGTINATSGSFTGTVNATSGSFTGTVNATGGTFNNVTIEATCSVLGTLNANQIVGDIVSYKPLTLSATTTSNGDLTVFDFYVSASTKARYFIIPPMLFTASVSNTATSVVYFGSATQCTVPLVRRGEATTDAAWATCDVNFPVLTIPSSGSSTRVRLVIRRNGVNSIGFKTQNCGLLVAPVSTGTFV